MLAVVAAAVSFNLFISWKLDAENLAAIEDSTWWGDDAQGRQASHMVLDSSYAVVSEHRMRTTSTEARIAQWCATHPDQTSPTRVAVGNRTFYVQMTDLSAAVRGASANDGTDASSRREPVRPAPRSQNDDDSDDDDRDEGDRADRADVENLEELMDLDDLDEMGYDAAELLETGHLVSYVDVTNDAVLISTVNGAFAAIGVIGAAVAALAGYFMGKRIERAQASQKRFYENMSHELKTPIASIRGYAEGARVGVVPVDESLRAIEGESQKMAGLIEESLSLSRLEAGTDAPKREPVCVADVVQDCLMPFEGTVRLRALDVRLDLAGGTIQADPDLLEHAITNLISNAVRHAGSYVHIAFDGKAVTVANDGDVPAAEQIPHLFDRFYVGEGGSSGIGLAIVREIAAQHGWSTDAALTSSGALELRIRFA